MYSAYIIICSTLGAVGEREDKSGEVASGILQSNGFEVVGKEIVTDEVGKISASIKNAVDNLHADLVLTSGGTGFSKTDVTPEATRVVVERLCENINLAMLVNSLQFTDRAMLSRGISGIRKNSLVVNLPGSPKAVEENLGYAISAISHGLKILKGDEANCGRM